VSQLRKADWTSMHGRLVAFVDGVRGVVAAMPAGLSDEQEGRLRAQQVAAVLRMTPAMMGMNIFTALVVTAVMIEREHAWFVLVWTGLFVGFSAIGLVNWWQASSRPAPATVSRRAIRRIARSAAVPALLWGGLSIVLFGYAGADGRLLVSSIVMGTLCVGAFGLATVPAAALVYTVTITVCALVALSSAGGGYLATALLLVAFVGIIFLAIAWHSRLFNERFTHGLELEAKTELISLLLHDFQENASDWLWEADADGRLTMVSNRLLEKLGAGRPDVVGRTILDVLVGGRSAGAEELDRHIAAREAFADVLVETSVHGETHWWSVSAKPIFDRTGRFSGYRGVGSDVTAAKLSERRMDHIAHHDSLTDLPNRLMFRDRLDAGLRTVAATGSALAIHFVDLDDFKGVNDTLGHAAGDDLLLEVAGRLRAVAGEIGTIARLGGDEFAIIQPLATSNEAEPARLATAIVEAMRAPIGIAGARVVVGASVGIALAPRDGIDADHLLRRADLALYRAKADGRGTFKMFEPAIESALRERRALEDDLRQAIRDEALDLHFQPIVDLTSEAIVGAEALLRWNHPQRGWVSPSTFVPIAEETGLIVGLGEWVIRRACRTAAAWPGDMTIAVNLSPAQFRSPRLPAVIVGALAEHRLRPERLEIEITESVLVDEVAGGVIAQLRALGVSIALDDFGTGYASMSYLRRFPFDKIKVDQQFVRDAVGRPDCVAIVEAVAELGRKLGIGTVAEGVETSAELAIATQSGCTYGQGYHFGRPMPAARFAAVIAEREKLAGLVRRAG